jgi:hypothetical protein
VSGALLSKYEQGQPQDRRAELKESQMARDIGTGTILVKADAALPKDLRFESEPYVEEWKVVMDLDGNGLDRAIQKTGWTYFCLAGEVKTTVFGIDHQSMLRRAVERLLSRGKLDGFNSLEITRVTSVGSERFPLVRYATVSAKWRHIQESLFLTRGNHFSGSTRKSVAAGETTGIASDQGPVSQTPPKQSSAVAGLGR